jgi:hypothetical protein
VSEGLEDELDCIPEESVLIDRDFKRRRFPAELSSQNQGVPLIEVKPAAVLLVYDFCNFEISLLGEFNSVALLYDAVSIR